MSAKRHIAACLTAVLLLASLGMAQGIKVKRGAMVLFGSATHCSQPATIHMKKVQKATEQWKTIRSEGVRKGSARYDLLISEMNAAIKKAVRTVAEAEKCDCVVRKGDIKDRKGLKVQDLTREVLAELDS